MTEQPEISFNALVISLATTAAVHFGDAADPASGQRQPPNLEAAGHMIDLLSLLGEKTTGNLTPIEDQFLTRVLYELRMRFLDASRGGSVVVPSGSGG